MKNTNLFLVIIAGGSGTRFWPKSTSTRPKQLLSFGSPSEQSLLAQTLLRFESFIPQNQRILVTTQSLQKAVLEENLKIEILAEPQGRNTAPCIYWAARHVAEQDPQGVMVVMPADHYISDLSAFSRSVQAAAKWASENDDLVTLGIKPSRPETGYGYLKTSPQKTGSSHDIPVYKVENFVEKPNVEKAKEFVSSERYLWNGGMFLWRAEVILRAFDQYMPQMAQAWEKHKGRVEDAYPEMTATSIDYGIMEKSNRVVTLPLDCGWDDLGSWISLENLSDLLGKRQGKNVVMNGQLVSIDSSRNIIDIPNKTVALLGIHNLILVENGEALLIAHKDRNQEIREIVDEVKKVRPDLV